MMHVVVMMITMVVVVAETILDMNLHDAHGGRT